MANERRFFSSILSIFGSFALKDFLQKWHGFFCESEATALS